MNAKKLQELFNVSEQKEYILSHTTPSEIWHPCERRMVLLRTNPLDYKVAKKLFEIGNEFEEVAIKRLLKVVKVKSYQQPIVNEELDMKGIVDVILENGDFIEIKSTASDDVISNFTNFQEYSLSKKYFYQVQAYMLLLNRAYGIFYLIDRRTGNDYFFDVERDEAIIEEIKTKAIHIKEHIQKGTLPQRIEYYDLCRSCLFFQTCYPEEAQTAIKEVSVSSEFLKKLEIYYAIREKLKQYQKLENALKEELKQWDKGLYKIGDKIITISEYQRAFYDIPEEIKKQYVTYRSVKKIIF